MTQPVPAPAQSLARKIIIDLSIMTAIGLFLGFIGPFGTINAPLPLRLVSWVAFAWIGYAVYSPMSWLVNRLEASLHLPKPLLWLMGVAIATIPMTAIVWSIGFLPGPIQWPTLEQALTSYFYVFLIGGAVTAFFVLIESRQADGLTAGGAVQGDCPPFAEEEPTQASKFLPSFIDRLPPELGTGLLALEMEDHYVRAHTALGSDLVLMRLRDAMAELGGIEGMQVHRSWWVARGAVKDVKREGRNVRLVLGGGLEAPVSRANVQRLKDAGWI
ncbi:LytTR family transcriptional regulator [Erythrobacter jejuensis]|uniref:LytTR family transcriptional regulator n=2 Tax=Parerythrobacter jejuensis TaxID=795812 RepID=A0A845AUG9_9SPHN|nr:LytTR family transcriptional regulator [Parerythrobacter jejuensis]MXP33238.1 LytTR family transcriptional regulator [Parerythrobacter jejuensis]